MASFMALDPVSPGTTNLTHYRYRPQAGERSLLSDSTKHAADTANTGNRQKQTSEDEQTASAPQPPSRSGSSDFAAAVIAGALPPTPQSMNELIRRIGASEIPEESQARLKDLIA